MKKHDQQDESAGIAGEKRPWRDFLRGSALQAVFLVLYLHIPLFTTGVWVFDPMRIDPQQGLAGVGEPNYQIIPAFYIASRSLKNGFLPTWSPFAGGGIPFIARQHSCIFSPSRLPFFILPEKIFPYLWLPTLFLWLYLAWACVYLLARAWDLPHWLCVFAGSVYSMSFLILPLRLYPSAEASVLAPAMILLADTYLNTRSRKALLLLPWVVLHPLLAGHFETAFRMYFATGAFFLLRLWKEQKYTLKESLRMIFHFTASAAAGLLIGFFQIASAMEYLHHSYINVWRNLPQFAFYLHNLSKKLSAGDLPPLLAGWALLLAGLFFLKRFSRRLKENKFWPSAVWFLLAGGSLAFSIASFMNIGMEYPGIYLSRFYLAATSLDPILMAINFALLSFSLFALSNPRLAWKFKILAILALINLLLRLKTPPIAHLFNSLPFFKLNFLRTYDPDTLLAVSLLAASGLKFVIYELRQSSWGQTWRQARGLLLTIALLGLSMAASPRLTDFSAGVTGVGINPLLQDQRQNELRGGIADAGLVKVFSKNHVVRGWFDPRAFPPVSGVWVGLHGRSDSFQPAQLSYSAQRVSFQGTVSLPPGESRPLAVLPHSREDRTVFAGSQISYEPIPFSTVWKTVLILALLLLFPLGIENRLLSRAVPLLLLAYCAWAMSAHSPHIVSAKDMPPRLGSMQWLKSDRDLFRTYSAEPNYFFQPEFPGIYGIQDLRSGADNMDVLAAVHFLHLVGPLAASASREHQKLAYQVLGLANVKYLFFRPYPRPVSPTLKKVYSGPEAVLYQNPYFQARALFFPASSARVLPTPDLKKWEAANQFLQALSQSILRGEIDPGRHLLLHQPVPPASPPASAPALAKPVPLLTYRAHEVVARVHSDQAGFLFLSDNHFPGWKAFLDGKPAPILPSWIAFRAVAVPAGTHDIRFIYEPRLLKRGIPFGALLGFLLIGLRLREKKGGAPGHPQSAPELSLLEILIYVPLGLSAWYWISWTAFVYQGNLWARGAAVLAGGILLREGWRLWRNRN